MPTQATLRNARDLSPEVLRNEIVNKVDQMERIQVGEGQGFASALNTFPLLDLDNPDESWYTMETVRGPMQSTALSSESPVGTIDLPDTDDLTTEPYKKKLQPEKGVQTELDKGQVNYSVFARAAAMLRLEIFVTREQITWRGDSNIEGLVGQHGNDPHSDIPTDQKITPSTSWDDTVNSDPYSDLSAVGHRIMNNGRLFGAEATPTIYMSPSTARDMKRNEDFKERVSGVRVQSLDLTDVQELLDEDLGAIRRVMVYLPRTNANGEYIDENGNVVESADQAALDNVLDPYDPGAGTQVRHAIVGRPGVNSANIPWFSDALSEYESDVPPNGDVAVDNQNGFMTQVWSENDPLTTWYKAAQEIGFHLATPENWAVISDV